MRQYIRDLTEVQLYFVYVEKTENCALLGQLKKDRKLKIEEFSQLIK